jgi:hypothetical protein
MFRSASRISGERTPDPAIAVRSMIPEPSSRRLVDVVPLVRRFGPDRFLFREFELALDTGSVPIKGISHKASA